MTNLPPEEIERIAEDHIFYVHIRRIIFGLLVILFLTLMIMVLYYNGKIIYEKGLDSNSVSYASPLTRA
jgi:hypothetical protein